MDVEEMKEAMSKVTWICGATDVPSTVRKDALGEAIGLVVEAMTDRCEGRSMDDAIRKLRACIATCQRAPQDGDIVMVDRFGRGADSYERGILASLEGRRLDVLRAFDGIVTLKVGGKMAFTMPSGWVRIMEPSSNG